MAITIQFDVSYGQFAVFTRELAQPFNDWLDQHVAQGFAWRPGSVSFRTMVEAGLHEAEVEIVNRMGLVASDAVRVIEVPFDIPENGEIEIGGITETVPLTLPTGEYLLRCEFLQTTNSSGRLRLVFAKNEPIHFSILLADADLTIGDELLTTAQPAGS
jgi:hypothetical protein